MSTYVLIHGAWHGAWCWYKIIAGLEAAGHTVIAPDLPSLGIDRTPVADVTLESWTQSVCDILTAQAEPSILVGHSRAGIIISQAAERYPDKVRCLVYLSAFLLKNGEALQRVAETDEASLVGKNIIVGEDNQSIRMDQNAIGDIFFGDCSADDVALARTLLAPEAIMPSITPIHVSEENFGRVRRVYIECLRDKAMSPAAQKKMYSALPCERVLSIDTDHSPFFSKPDELLAHLLSMQ